MKNGTFTAGALALGLGLLASPPIQAQSLGQSTNRPHAVGTAAFETYSFADAAVADVERLSLVTTSFGIRVPVVGAARFGVTGRYARGELLRPGGARTTLQGLADTELNLSVPVRRGGLVTTLSALALLPTGSTALTEAEADLAGMVASELLPFRISNWGSGGALGASLATAYGDDRGSVGLSAGYVVGRRFEPFEPLGGAAFVYRPGNQVQLRAALDRVVGSAGKLTLALTLLHSEADRGGDRNLYQTGTRYQAMGSYSFAVGQGASAILYLGSTHREAGQPLQEVAPAIPAQDLVLFGGGARVPALGGVLLPSVDARVFRRASGEGQGYVTGLGTAWETGAGRIGLTPSVRARFGRLVMAEGLETGLTGLELGLAVRPAR